MEKHQDKIQSQERRRRADLRGTANSSGARRQWRSVLLPTTFFLVFATMINHANLMRQAHASTSAIVLEDWLLHHEQQQDPQTKKFNDQGHNLVANNRNDTLPLKGSDRKNEHFSACVKILDENDALMYVIPIVFCGVGSICFLFDERLTFSCSNTVQ